MQWKDVWKSTVGVALLGCLVPTYAEVVEYELIFDVTWSAASHPAAFPPGAHFSRLVGHTHNSDDSAYTLWEPGVQAARGIQNIAETGSTFAANLEMDGAIKAGTSGERFDAGGLGSGNVPGRRTKTFQASLEHPQVTFASMIAPSPDWFVGVSRLPLLQDGKWVPKIVVDMAPWDAGTDSGETFTSANLATSPHVPIAVLEEPFDEGTSLGSFAVQLLSIPGDVNNSDELDVGDVNAICAVFGESSIEIDLTGDSVVNEQDLRFWVEELKETRRGDANLDGAVMFDDFLALANGFNQQGTWTTGDFDCSGDTNLEDFLHLSQNFGFAASASPGAAAAAVVPEPSGLSMLSVALLCVSRRRKRVAGVNDCLATLSCLVRANPS